MCGMRVGLTGGVASGKSTASAILSDLGAVVIDADQLAREVVAPGTDGLAEVVDAFGSGVLTSDGELDRPALGRVVFADPEKRAVLERIIHPRVRARGAELEAAAGPDAVVLVDVPAELQVERMTGLRGMTEEDARARMAAQATAEQRRAIATYVIDNTGTLEDHRRRVTEVFEELVGASR